MGASSRVGRESSSLVPGFMPKTGGISSGEGRYSMTASRRGCTPLLRSAEPQYTGVAFPAITALRKPAFSSSMLISSPSRYLSVRASSASAICSSIFARRSSASALRSAGMSLRSGVVPNSSVQIIASPSIRSTTPMKSASSPIGIWTGMGFAPRRSRMLSTVFS